MKPIAVLMADGFQDNEYFLPKSEFERVGLKSEVISLEKKPLEIYSYFSKIGLLDVDKRIDEVNPADYAGVLVPGGAKSPAILAESKQILSFLRAVDAAGGMVACICRGTLLVATSGIAKGRNITGFHHGEQYPELVVKPIVEKYGGIWNDNKPVVVDKNLISSRHPDDTAFFTKAILTWTGKESN